MAAGRYILNNKDLFTVFGTVVESGSGSFLSLPKRKESLSHDFSDQNGLDIDLLDPRFEAREFRIKCALTANSREDFWNKYNALFTELSRAGVHKLFITDLDKQYICYYKDQANLSKLTPLAQDKVWIRFELVFGETDWTDNIEAVYLVDHDGNYLIA